ncbi:tetraacyldisaccharide 4'-kinase [Tenacibaculum amylolyticum]|uniref:tetraacyldisaccharide 4'-kinase n=1 Tax=Tenacibaculum amylolyticum TaxID=104269 RepID=UPI00389370C0
MKLVRFLLFPFAIIYDIITSIRNLFFDRGILKSTSFKIPVIAVGNLSVGGTGKTPQIEYLIRLLKDDYKIAVLSRGYKRKTKGFQLVNDSHTAEDVGDEPLQFYSKFKGIHVAVDVNRTEGIQKLQELIQPDIVLLDDAFQHRKVNAGHYILLTKYNDLYSKDFLLPTGNLRESRSGAKRAKSIVVTKCPSDMSDIEREKIKKQLKVLPEQQVFFTTISYDEDIKGEEKAINITDLKDEKVTLVTGIANPTPLLSYLDEKEIEYKHVKFPDHHHFSSQDILKIEATRKQLNEDGIILTTEKDYVRLQGKLANVFYIEIRTEFIKNEEGFNMQVEEFVRSF